MTRPVNANALMGSGVHFRSRRISRISGFHRTIQRVVTRKFTVFLSGSTLLVSLYDDCSSSIYPDLQLLEMHVDDAVDYNDIPNFCGQLIAPRFHQAAC